MSKQRIAIVAGYLHQPRMLSLYESLAKDFDVSVHCFETPGVVSSHRTGLRLVLTECIEDMPGYMRGLEDGLETADLVIAHETSRLSSFQAQRAALTHGIPFGVVCNEALPYFYSRYENIRAIQYDIYNHAHRFWPTSVAAAQCLRLDHVPEDLIRTLPPVAAQRIFANNERGRDKFRKYIKLGTEHLIWLYQGPIEAHTGGERLIRALHFLKQRIPAQAAAVRLIIAGEGDAAKDWKYLAYDLGIGSQVMFLHQDTSPFVADLFSAADLFVRPRQEKSDLPENYPLEVLEASIAGAVPVVGAGTVEAELTVGFGLVDDGHTVESLAAVLQPVTTDRVRLAKHREEVLRQVPKFNPRIAGSILLQEVKGLLDGASHKPRRGAQNVALAEQMEQRIVAHDPTGALIELTEALNNQSLSNQERSTLCRLRGDALYALGHFEDATNAYGEAVHLCESNFSAFRGLGRLAWRGHSHEEALTFYRRALAIKDDDVETMLGIGMVYRRLGLHEEALFWLERCLTHSQDPTHALTALTQTCLECGRPETGIKVLERVRDTQGDSPSLLMTLARLYMNQGRTEVGQEMLKRAMNE